jgi:sterol desaturase/sphingolipid hydroxylase (fatty acid hydroxylase superfamily)
MGSLPAASRKWRPIGSSLVVLVFLASEVNGKFIRVVKRQNSDAKAVICKLLTAVAAAYVGLTCYHCCGRCFHWADYLRRLHGRCLHC